MTLSLKMFKILVAEAKRSRSPELAARVENLSGHLDSKDERTSQTFTKSADTDPKQGSHGASTEREDVASAILEGSSDTAKHINFIRLSAGKGNLKEVMSFFRSLQANGTEITTSLWNATLDACVECRDFDQAT